MKKRKFFEVILSIVREGIIYFENIELSIFMIDEENCIIFFRLIFKGIESFVYFDLEIIGFERIFDIV